jgi:hypothetical protein
MCVRTIPLFFILVEYVEWQEVAIDELFYYSHNMFCQFTHVIN